MENITLIAAIGKNNELGKDNGLIWHIPEDLKFFKEQTTGKQILMGRKTLDSLPGLLPKRKHLVLTTRTDLEESDMLKVFHDLDSLKQYLSLLQEEVMVIGGAQIYATFLPESSKLILTEIDAEAEADAYFPSFEEDEWDKQELCSHEHNGLNYKHLVYTRKQKSKEKN